MNALQTHIRMVLQEQLTVSAVDGCVEADSMYPVQITIHKKLIYNKLECEML